MDKECRPPGGLPWGDLESNQEVSSSFSLRILVAGAGFAPATGYEPGELLGCSTRVVKVNIGSGPPSRTGLAWL